MKLTISSSKNSESYYVSQSYINENGISTTRTVRPLGTLRELQAKLGTDRDGVIAWAREQVRLETEKYNREKEDGKVSIALYSKRQMSYGVRKLFNGGYLFPQYFYYQLQLDDICRKIRRKHKYEYDINAILSDLIYTRILAPCSKIASYDAACRFLEAPSYERHDVYRALSVLAEECDFIQSEVFKNSHFISERKDTVLYYDCTNYYFETEQADEFRKYGKSKEHRPNPIVQMGLFMDGGGIPLAFSMFPGNKNEQTSLKPLEKKVLESFGCEKFVYCADAGLASESIREFNHLANRAFIVTQSIKKLKNEDKEWALNMKGFRRLRDGIPVDINDLPEDGMNEVYYKEMPYTGKKVDQRLIITYSPKYAAYQKTLRAAQIERAKKMIEDGKRKKERKNPNDPARFIAKMSVTGDGEIATKDSFYLDVEKIAEEEKYDGLYAICTDLLDDDPNELIKISEGRWQIEQCFRIMKTDFEARPVYLQREDRIKAHFLVCFLALLIYRLMEQKLQKKYTCSELLTTLREMYFADIGGQGFEPAYVRTELTDALHDMCHFRTDYEFISKRDMRTIQKKSKGKS